MAQVESVEAVPGLSAAKPVRIALPLAMAAVATVLAYWAIDSSSPALTDLKDDLGFSSTVAGLVFSFFFGGRLLGNFPAARLIDRLGPAVTAAAGGATLMAGAVLVATATNAPVVLVARLLEGAGVALVINAGLLSIVRARPGAGAAMTMFTFLSTVGGVLGIAFGGGLTEAIGWRSVFVLHFAIGAAALALGLAGRTRGPLQVAATSTTSEAVIEEAPSRDIITTGLIANFLVFINYSVWAVAMPLYADERFDASPEQISTLLLTMTAGHLVLAYPVGAIIKRWGSIQCLMIGNAITAASMLLMLTAPSLWMLIPPLAIYSLGQVAASNAAGDFLLQRSGSGGKGVGMLRLSCDLGLVLGPAAVGALADIAGFRAPFLALPILTTLGAALTLTRLKRGVS
jgi:MFS family permease